MAFLRDDRGATGPGRYRVTFHWPDGGELVRIVEAETQEDAIGEAIMQQDRWNPEWADPPRMSATKVGDDRA